MATFVRLSTTGSDRATGYNMSSKLIRRDDCLFIGWLDTAASPSAPHRIQLGMCDVKTGELWDTFCLGEGIDNHCGPAMALDKQGRLHMVIGAHSGVFQYRWSDDPKNLNSWSEPEALGPRDTYPSMAVDDAGTLHLAHREQGERWQLWYRRKRVGQPWETPIVLATSPTPGYNHHMQSLTIGPDGSIHITFQYHYAESGQAIDCTGYMAVHLQSNDGGNTWFNEGIRCSSLPLTIKTAKPIVHYPNGGMRIGNHVVDANNRPWFFATLPDMPGGALIHRTDAGWSIIDMAAAFGGLNFIGSRSTSISRDALGHIHLAAATNPDGHETPWFDPSHELFYLVLAQDGVPISNTQVTSTNPTTAHWLPALEQWDWTRPDTCCIGGPWFMFTEGLNEGGIGGNNANTLKTAVYLTKM